MPAITQPILNGTHRSIFPLHFHRDFQTMRGKKAYTLRSPLLFTFIIIERCTINFSVDCFYSFVRTEGGRSYYSCDFKPEGEIFYPQMVLEALNLNPIFDWGRFIFHKTKEKNHFNASKKYNKLEALNSATFLASQLECIYVFSASVYPLRF